MEKGKLLGQGNTAEIYECSTDKILKLYKSTMPDKACESEFYITENINRTLGIGPKAYEIIYLDGRIGAIYEKVAGKTMLNEMLSKIWTINKRSKLLAYYHSEIQKKIDFKLLTVKEKLKENIESVGELTLLEKDKLLRYLETLPEGNILCHFDFHPDNIILNKGRPIVIDWMTACIGEGAADIARTCLILKYSEVPMKSRFIQKLIRKFQNKVYQNYIGEYLKITNTKMVDIQKWEVPIAAARLCEWIPENEKNRLMNIVRQSI